MFRFSLAASLALLMSVFVSACLYFPRSDGSACGESGGECVFHAKCSDRVGEDDCGSELVCCKRQPSSSTSSQPPPAALGAECRFDSACSSGRCDTDVPGGMCTARCDDDGDCGQHTLGPHACGADKRCYLGCTLTCARAGFACVTDGTHAVCKPAD